MSTSQGVDEGQATVLPCACARLRATARAVTQLYDLVLSPTALKATQFIILKAIHDSREVAQCDLARQHSIAVETLSRRLGGLRRKGYVQVKTGPRHGERIYSLTESGRRALSDATPYWVRAQDRLRAALGDEGWHKMLEISGKIREAAVHAETARAPNHVRLLPVPAGNNGNHPGNHSD